jgi:hypothetical protein
MPPNTSGRAFEEARAYARSRSRFKRDLLPFHILFQAKRWRGAAESSFYASSGSAPEPYR